ncbi:MAG: hypothetical protein WBP45_01955 [Daejeonella sp.]
MRKISVILFLAIISSCTSREYNNNDPFYLAVKSLEKINYFIKDVHNCENINPKTNGCIEKPREDDCFVNLAQLAKINTSGLVEINHFFVKSTKDFGDYKFPRADIREWRCESVQDAKEIEKIFEKSVMGGHMLDCANMSSMAWWRKNDKLYVITIGGHYMLNELPKLEKQLKSKL